MYCYCHRMWGQRALVSPLTWKFCLNNLFKSSQISRRLSQYCSFFWRNCLVGNKRSVVTHTWIDYKCIGDTQHLQPAFRLTFTGKEPSWIMRWPFMMLPAEWFQLCCFSSDDSAPKSLELFNQICRYEKFVQVKLCKRMKELMLFYGPM